MVECSLSLQGRETLGPSSKFSGDGPVGLAWTTCLSLLGVEVGALRTYMAFAHEFVNEGWEGQQPEEGLGQVHF